MIPISKTNLLEGQSEEITISGLRARPGDVFMQVQMGKKITVTKGGEVIAEIKRPEPEFDWAALQALRKLGGLYALVLGLMLSSCVNFHAASGATYSGPPWGKVAYSNGQEMFTSDHDAGWVATVTGIQNFGLGIGTGLITGGVTKAVTESNNAASVATARSANILKTNALAKPATTTIVPPGSTTVTTPAPVLFKP
jgi:uncharacterized membrane protein YedE/YeeE